MEFWALGGKLHKGDTLDNNKGFKRCEGTFIVLNLVQKPLPNCLGLVQKNLTDQKNALEKSISCFLTQHHYRRLAT